MDPITGVAVQQLYNTLASEHRLWNEFQNQVEIMKNKIKVMTSFQEDTQWVKRADGKHKTLKTILDQVRDLVYDADDFLLDCQTRAAYEKITGLGYSTPRGISFQYNAVRTLKNFNSKIAEMENLLRTYGQMATKNQLKTCGHMATKSDGGSSQGGTTPLRHTSPRLGEEKIIGLEEDTKIIIKYITRDDNSSSIGIVGMGGLGKTTLASKVYNHIDVVGHFDERIWVSVSKKFSPEDIQKSMLKQLKLLQSDDENVLDAMLKIQESLNNKKYLIVMDDVWDPDGVWWGEISPYLPEGERTKKSIIITTRNEDDAKTMKAAYIHHAHVLNRDESWALFSEFAFHQAKSKGENPEFEEIGRAIVEKCNGLPLSIKTVAGLLQSKKRLQEWDNVRDNFHNELATNTSVQGVLQLSYDDLPARLKQCILSFSIYPEDSEIDAEQLIYWWVGEGFVCGNGKSTAIEEASQCLSELVNRCLVGAVKRRGYDGRVYKCKMQDMVRDLIIRISSKKAFSSFDLHKKQNPGSKSRHLGYTSEMENKIEGNNSKLRAFILMEDSVLPSVCRSELSTVNGLRVLDLSQNKQANFSAEDLLQWLRIQKRLAYLNLRKLHDLKHLPKWIRKHQNLQILVIKECINLKKLPSCVTTLQNLIVLDVENCALENLPQGLGKLSKLEVLSGFKLGSRGKDGACFSDLKRLQRLRVLRICLTEKYDILDENEGKLSQLCHLKVLSIVTKNYGEKHVELVKKLVPPPSLIELYLMSYQGDTTPDWITPTILPELLYLHIDASPITSVSKDFWVGDGNEWKIEGLCFMRLPSFHMKWGEIQENMKHLRYVEVSLCYGLQSFPIDVKSSGVWVKDDFEHEFKNQEVKASIEASTPAPEM